MRGRGWGSHNYMRFWLGWEWSGIIVWVATRNAWPLKKTLVVVHIKAFFRNKSLKKSQLSLMLICGCVGMSHVTFWPLQVLPGEVKGEAMRQTTPLGLCKGHSKRKGYEGMDMAVRRCCCPTHTGSEVSNRAGNVVQRLWSHHVHFGLVDAVWFCRIVCGLLVDFQWPVSTWLRIRVLETPDGVVVAPSPPGLASGLLRTFNEHF